MKSEGITENSKEKILLTATKLFAQKGFDGVSVRDICKKANINVSMISYYWGGKKELYQNIIDNLIQRQTEYAKTFIDFNMNLNALSKKQKIKFLQKLIDKIVDFVYLNVSDDLVLFLVRAQQTSVTQINSPALNFVKKLIAGILNKKETDRKVILSSILLISQISAPRIFPFFSLKQSNQKDFTEKDIRIIKDNLKKYIEMIF